MGKYIYKIHKSPNSGEGVFLYRHFFESLISLHRFCKRKTNS